MLLFVQQINSNVLDQLKLWSKSYLVNVKNISKRIDLLLNRWPIRLNKLLTRLMIVLWVNLIL